MAAVSNCSKFSKRSVRSAGPLLLPRTRAENLHFLRNRSNNLFNSISFARLRARHEIAARWSDQHAAMWHVACGISDRKQKKCCQLEDALYAPWGVLSAPDDTAPRIKLGKSNVLFFFFFFPCFCFLLRYGAVTFTLALSLLLATLP